MKNYDVLVVGAGPAGTTSARILAEKGISVAILEKEQLPRYKACGGGIVFKALKHLPSELSGVVDIEFKSAEIYVEPEGMCFRVERNLPMVSMVKRDILDMRLTELACSAGAELFEKNDLQAIETGTRTVLRCSAGSYMANYVIAADGVYSKTARLAGWRESRKLIPALEYEIVTDNHTYKRLVKQLRFDIAFVPGGYAWLFPKKEGFSIGVLTTRKGRINLKKYYGKYLEKLGIKQIISEKATGSAIPVSPRKDGFYKNNILLAGDAAGLADPVTAEGITHALLSGRLLAESIYKAFDNSVTVESLYMKKLEKHILTQLVSARHLARLLYNSCWLRKILFKKRGQYICEKMVDLFTDHCLYPDRVLPEMISLIRNKKIRHY